MIRATLTASLLALPLLGACAATSSEPESADSAAAEEEAVPVQEEVPDVTLCHTETQTCELDEPLQPGLGCFCTNEDGKPEAGSAGG